MLSKQTYMRSVLILMVFQAVLLLICLDWQSVYAQVETSKIGKLSYEDCLESRITCKLFPPNQPVAKPTIFEVSISKDGTLTGWKQIKSCGNSLIDKCAEMAITKAAPFPPFKQNSSVPAVRRFQVTIDPFCSLNRQKTVFVVEKRSQ